MRISDWSSDVCSSDLIGLERAQYIEKFAKIVFVRHRDSKGLRCRGLGHEPEAELGHDAKIGLCEEPVDPGPVTKFEELPAGTLGHSTHPCPDTAAVGQHQLKPALHKIMIGIWGIAHAPLQKGARHRFVGLTRAIDPELEPPLAYLFGELPKGDAWLDEAVSQVLIDLENLIHAAKIEQYDRSEEHTSELQSLMRISYAVFCLKKK